MLGIFYSCFILGSCVYNSFGASYNLPYDKCPCSYNASTKTADCDSKNLRQIPDCVPRTTENLNMILNPLIYHPGQFQKFTVLKYLDLSLNPLYTPRSDSFTGLKKLKVLFLNSTRLIMVHTALFTESTNLEVLSLKRCGLLFLSNDFFSHLKKLVYLDLSSNLLSDIENIQLSDLNILQYLDLSGNLDLILNGSTFSGLSNLQKLDLSSCGLSDLDNGVLSRMYNLTWLDLSYNSFKEIRTDNLPLRSNVLHLDLCCIQTESLKIISPFTNFHKLKYLSLASNNIEPPQLPDLFDPLISLEYLDLSSWLVDQKQMKSYSRLFKNLHSLIKLDLSNNNIKNLSADTFESLNNLRHLSVAQNLLAQVTFNINVMPLLEMLDISTNNIPYLPPQITTQLDSIARYTNLTLFVSHNPLSCDCERIDFVTWLEHTNIIYEKDDPLCKLENGSYMSIRDISQIVDSMVFYCGKLSCECDKKAFEAWLHNIPILFPARSFTCKYPNDTEISLAGNPELLEVVKLQCIATAILIGCVFTFVVLNLFLTIIALFWYRRWKIKYLLAVARSNMNPYHPLEGRDTEMEYDAYISYGYDSQINSRLTMHDFVTQTIYPQLQRRFLNVSIREDFHPGMQMYHSIPPVLQKCGKVITLISKDYCKDKWNIYEFNTAVLEGIYTKRQVVLPIVFGRLEREDLHLDVYTYLRNRPVYRYSSTLSDDVFINFLVEQIKDRTEIE